MLIEIDCDVLCTKKQLLESLMGFFDEMYSPNYDALIDTASTYESKLTIEVHNLGSFENPADLQEVLEIICKENELVTLVIK